MQRNEQKYRKEVFSHQLDWRVKLLKDDSAMTLNFQD